MILVLRKKIILMFVANHMEMFNNFIKEKGVLENPLTPDYLLDQAANISGFLTTDVDDIVSFESFYENAGISIAVEEPTIKEAIKRCDTDIVVALDNDCELFFQQNEILIKLACDITDKKQIEMLLNALRHYADNFLLLKSIFFSFKHYGCFINEDKIDFLIASFVKDNGPVVDTWLSHLNAINPGEKKEIINGWVDDVLESKRIMHELFYSENSRLI